ncbi:Mariner Mos1 transposase [Eumeta japonica]|uniref:Mariner Mos1 transposase n=1 Tax=Eumeta variegata TaxID=151549 RepID=A0A4C1XS58_EUMVA|nr:Mariner Mos1 transposase [Eumeta japonica]
MLTYRSTHRCGSCDRRRPQRSVFEEERILEAFKEDPTFNTRNLSRRFNNPQAMVWRIVHAGRHVRAVRRRRLTPCVSPIAVSPLLGSEASARRSDGRFCARDCVLNAELEVLLDQDSCQTQQELAGSLGVTQQAISKRLKVMEMIQKQGHWMPHELKPRDVERRLFACEQLLARQKRKGFLHRIVTADEKWVHYDNPKRRKSWGYPGHASTSTAKPNIHGSKVMLSIWWDQLGVVHHKLLKPTETITGDRYRTQLMRLSRALKDKRSKYNERHDKVISSMTTLDSMLRKSSRASYGDDAISYVQLKRDAHLCTVKCKMCPEHKVHAKLYGCTLIIDEEDDVIVSVVCEDCVASRALIEKVKEETIEQSKSNLWFELRYGRITASKAYEVSRCKTADGTLVSLILGGKIPETKHMKRGRVLEDQVRRTVEDIKKLPSAVLY